MLGRARHSSQVFRIAYALAPLLSLGLAGCDGGEAAGGSRPDGRDGTATSEAELPAPEGTIGSVTGMPAHPGPGTSPIEPAATVGADPATASAADAYAGLEDIGDVDGIEPVMPVEGVELPLQIEDPLAEASPIAIVPEIPRETVAPPQRRPIGTEAATESTTIVVEPDDTGD